MTGKYPARLNLTDYILKPQQHQDGISLQPLLEDRQMDERPLFWHYPHYSGGLGGRPSLMLPLRRDQRSGLKY